MKKIVIVLFGLLIASAFFYFDLGQYLSLDYLKSQNTLLQETYNQNKLVFILVYLVIYIISTALSFPGATILTLAGGAIFGWFFGTILVSFASTVGATFAFLGARYLLRDTVQKRFQTSLDKIDEGIQKEGAFYLFSLRLIPVVPFFVINLALGLTRMKTWTFFWVSQLGMLLGTAAYVKVGTEIVNVTSLKGLLSPSLISTFVFVGLLPIIAKKIVETLRSRKAYSRFKKPAHFDYNLVAIGAGAAGLVTAYIGAAVKAKVALIEKHKMGGDCLNTGCVPSKALIRSAKFVHDAAQSKKYGIETLQLNFNFSQVMERIQSVIKKIEPHDSIERYQNLGVDCITGTARILSPFEIEVNGKKITTKNIVIATGARPLVPPIAGLDQVKPWTSDSIWDLRTQPKRLLVLGGGPIGCELAQSFARLGSKVYLIEKGPRILPREDQDVSDLIEAKFKQENIQVLTNHTASEFSSLDGTKRLHADNNGQKVEIEFDEVLLALGRSANVKGFGLEELGIQISKKGTIEADPFLRTNIPNIFVCGDVTGPFQFTHTASHQAWFCAVNALFSPFKKFKVDYSVIPWATYVDPEVARVGLNELEAKEKNIPYEVSHYGIDELDRAITDSADEGFIKVLTKPGTDKILGATIVGAHASDIIVEYIAAMKHGFGMNKILGTIHIYPTMGEANKYVAGNWKRKNSPQWALEFLQKFHSWRRT